MTNRGHRLIFSLCTLHNVLTDLVECMLMMVVEYWWRERGKRKSSAEAGTKTGGGRGKHLHVTAGSCSARLLLV